MFEYVGISRDKSITFNVYDIDICRILKLFNDNQIMASDIIVRNVGKYITIICKNYEDYKFIVGNKYQIYFKSRYKYLYPIIVNDINDYVAKWNKHLYFYNYACLKKLGFKWTPMFNDLKEIDNESINECITKYDYDCLDKNDYESLDENDNDNDNDNENENDNDSNEEDFIINETKDNEIDKILNDIITMGNKKDPSLYRTV